MGVFQFYNKYVRNRVFLDDDIYLPALISVLTG